MVAAFIEKGYADRITSHDASCHLDWLPEGIVDKALPTWNYTHIPLDIVPMRRERGVSDGAIDQMTVHNPCRPFEQGKPY